MSRVLSPRVLSEIKAANQSDRVPVLFIHGLWLLGSSWANWADVFSAQGYAPILADWPGDPERVEEARERPDAFRGQMVASTLDHLTGIVQALEQKPVIVGHSFGGLFAQMLAAQGRSRATVALVPAPFQGLLPLPLSAIRAALPVLGAPWTWGRAVQLTKAQYRYGWSNAIAERESADLFDRYHVPAPTKPLLAAATANFNPWASTRVDTSSKERGPLLLVAGAEDHTVPVPVVRAAFKLQQRNPALTRLEVVLGRGHSLTIDSGWREIADLAARFFREHGGTDRAGSARLGG